MGCTSSKQEEDPVRSRISFPRILFFADRAPATLPVLACGRVIETR